MNICNKIYSKTTYILVGIYYMYIPAKIYTALLRSHYSGSKVPTSLVHILCSRLIFMGDVRY